MKYIAAILLVVFSITSFGESLTVRDYTPRPVAVKPMIKKVKLLRSNPYRFTAIRIAHVNPADVVDDEDIIPQRRYRSKLEQEIDDEMSDYVKTRLLIARTRALQKYLETHT